MDFTVSVYKQRDNLLTRVYGAEHAGGPRMHNAKKAGHLVPVELDGTSISMPPTAGASGFEVVKKHVDDILLVDDDDIRVAVAALYKRGLVVEPLGAAAFAALLSGKVPDVENKSVVVFLTGSNVSASDLQRYVERN